MADVVDSHIIDTGIDVDKTCFLRCFCVLIIERSFSHLNYSFLFLEDFLSLSTLAVSLVSLSLSLSLNLDSRVTDETRKLTLIRSPAKKS